MNLKRCFLCWVLVLCLIWCTAFSSLAGIASKSTASRSVANRNMFESSVFDYALADDGIMALSSDNYGVDWYYAGYTSKGVVVKFTASSDGFYTASAPAGSTFIDFRLVFENSSLPSSGTYGFSCSLNQGHVDYVLDGASVQFDVISSNVTPSFQFCPVSSYNNTGFSYDLSANLQISPRVKRVSARFWLSSRTLTVLSLGSPTWSFYFSALDGATDVNTDPSYNVDDSINSSVMDIADSAGSIQENTSELVNQQSQTNSLLLTVIQTISNQLKAFWDQLAGEFTNLYNQMSDQHEEQLENDNANTEQVTDAIETHGNFIIEGLKSLFIPSDEYFKSWFDNMYQFFNDRLGFLMLPVDLLIEFVDLIKAAGTTTPGVPFPEFKWIDGTVLIPAQTVGFTFLDTDWGKDIQTKLYFVGDVIMIGALLSLMHRKFEEVLRN